MENKSKGSKRDLLHDALKEAVGLQAAHRSTPKEQRLLKLLTDATSSDRGGGSTSDPQQVGRESEGLIAEVMSAAPGMTRERAIKALREQGGI